MNQKTKTILGYILITLEILSIRQLLNIILIVLYIIELNISTLLLLFNRYKLYYLLLYNRPSDIINYYYYNYIVHKIEHCLLLLPKQLKKPFKFYVRPWSKYISKIGE